MHAIQGFFLLIAYFAIPILILWWAVSSVNRMTRGIEDMAETLRRIEQQGRS